MKFFGVVVGILGTATGAWAGDGVLTPKRAVTACLNPGANISVMYRGQAIAGQILKNAGIRLDWSHDERTCAERKGILFAVSLETSPEQHAGALAYALPFDGTRVVLFYDRVLNTEAQRQHHGCLGTCWHTRSSTYYKVWILTRRAA